MEKYEVLDHKQCVVRTLLTLFTHADSLYKDLVFDLLTPVTSSNPGFNQILVRSILVLRTASLERSSTSTAWGRELASLQETAENNSV